MKFPYGNADFYKIITENYVYIDRSDRIRLIENLGDTLLLLRPRRFGKSWHWFSSMHNLSDYVLIHSVLSST